MGLGWAWVVVALAADAAHVAPVEKVLTMITDLANKVNSEGVLEAQNYDKYSCFCKSSTDAKNRAIEEGTSQVALLTSDIQLAQADRNTLREEIATLEDEVKTLQEEIVNETASRGADHDHFEVADKQMNAAIKGISQAIATIKAGSKSEKTEENGVPMSDYGGSGSSERTDTLEALHGTFRNKEQDVVTEETSAKTAFLLQMQAKNDLIKQKQLSAKAKSDMADRTSSTLATLQASATRANAELNDDKLYLKALGESCAAKKTEYDQRSTLRNGELAALTQAKVVLEGDVVSMGAATGEGGREGVSQLKVKAVVHPAKAATLQMSVSMVQVRSVKKLAPWRPDASRAAVSELLSKTASRLGSTELSALAMTVGTDPFAKVKGLIENMVSRLQQEAANDATHQSWCVEETHKSEGERDYRLRELNHEDAHTRKLQAHKAQLEDEKKVLEDEIQEITDEHATAEGVRNNESAVNTQTIADAKDGAIATKEAIGILADFYNASKSAEVPESLLQSRQSPDLDAPDTGFKGAYQGSQGGASGVVGMLEVILGDFTRMDEETTAGEAAAVREWTVLSREMQDSKGTKESALTATDTDINTATDDLATSKDNIRSGQKLLDTAVKSLDNLHASCLAGGTSGGNTDQSASTGGAADRKERREAEIAALRDAMCILGDCEAGTTGAFLQRK